ncbi:hypothetical protein [Prolixibacter sp. SD074]|uniref:hypothetical protein n=1 Tax=Prolixibacter sp. SD074 TaxID=2652391 RepID=UPI00126ED44D|nr:hypothetical protein [Prolixibacter sp. SD074]GET28550.1 hypothetical protein SD074_07520 [Prolixibacter sp. SD074]
MSDNYYIIGKETLNELQVLRSFVDFVAGQPETPPEQRKLASDIKYSIENFDKPETFKEWGVCIDIYDPVIQSKSDGGKGGMYWKKWWLWFELGLLEICIEEEYVDKDGYLDEEQIFYGYINFNKNIKGPRTLGDHNYQKFLEDAFQFRNDITDSLNNVETELNLW